MVIALVTDFGTRDYYVGAVKGVILSMAPAAVIADITHDIPPHDVAAAAFILGACYRDFPRDTVFVCVVDPGVGSRRRGIVVRSGGYRFVGPDNGIFTSVIDGGSTIVEITNEDHFRKPVSPTFHARDVFAPVAARLWTGVPLSEVGPRVEDPVLLPVRPSSRSAKVIHVDRFGNVVTSITADEAVDGLELKVGRTVVREQRHFYDGAPAREAFLIAGSSGFLEIAVNCGSAAELLDVKVGDDIEIRIDQDER
jgi:S-adenosylmethionine hydrolase